MGKTLAPFLKRIRQKWFPATWESQRLVLIAALIIIILAVVLNGSASVYSATALLGDTASPASAAAPTATLRPEIQDNQSQTNGMIIGGVILVLIIVGGTLGVIRRKPIE